tara:strand:- start:595 stop:915 length:321 start_codon:yes stop_codon:yes gene_type:complete
VSKKKSYMDKENIISEGFFSKLMKAVIPAAIGYKVYQSSKKSYINKINKKIEKSKKNIKDAEKRVEIAKKEGEKALEDMTKFLSKETGKTISKQSAKKAYKDFIGK